MGPAGSTHGSKAAFAHKRDRMMKLDFGPPIATFRGSAPASLTSSFHPRMAPRFSDIVEEARLSARALLDYGEGFFNPTVRLGVTGLSRAGKTVFITALIHGLTRGGRFPVFEPYASGRIARARLEPQPDDAVPRFAYEDHVRTLIEERRWPSSTVDISRAAAGHRLSAAKWRGPHADHRHRRLSRRVAARPAAADQELRAMVGREPRAVARRPAPETRRALA